MTIHKQMTRNKQAGCASTRRFARDSAQAHVQPGTVLEPSKICPRLTKNIKNQQKNDLGRCDFGKSGIFIK